MPANKAETFISRSVQSVLSQSYTNWELIIISNDGVDYLSVLENHGITDKRIKFVSANKTGVSYARNIGLENARGNIIANLDSDDMFYREKLKYCVPIVKQNYLVSCALDICDSNGNTLRYVGETKEKDGILQSSKYKQVNFSGDNMILFDRTKIQCTYDENLSCAEDLEFLLQCFEFVDHTYHVSTPLHKYYKKPNSITNNVDSHKEFTAAKIELLSRLENKFYKFQDKQVKENMTHFLQASLKTESLFEQDLVKNPQILFEDIIESII